MLKINCLHGFFIFEESEPGQISRFTTLFGLSFARWREAFTFENLENAPTFAISGQKYLNAAVDLTFAGEPWDIMKANGLVYNFGTGELIKKSEVKTLINLEQSGAYWLSSGLILPGSLLKDGRKIHSYNAHFSFNTLRFRYSGVDYD